MDVKDHGIGIPEGDVKHMFERFFSAQNATNIQGTGLGLNIVKKYIDLMNGDIWFESQAREGLGFQHCFTSKVSVMKKILLIEDNPKCAKTLRKFWNLLVIKFPPR
jgi:signal transduction histidine kinase